MSKNDLYRIHIICLIAVSSSAVRTGTLLILCFSIISLYCIHICWKLSGCGLLNVTISIIKPKYDMSKNDMYRIHIVITEFVHSAILLDNQL